jgi:hypothetical protein
MNKARGERGEGRTGCVLWLIFVGLIAYLLYEVVPVRISAGQFQDAMQEQATFAASHSDKEIATELVTKASELRLPIHRDQLTITRTRESIAIEAEYTVPIQFFGIWTYPMSFHPLIGRPLISM